MCYWPIVVPPIQTAVRWACQVLTEAIAMYRQIGRPKHQKMAEEMLGEL